jgi:hypothetical protein
LTPGAILPNLAALLVQESATMRFALLAAAALIAATAAAQPPAAAPAQPDRWHAKALEIYRHAIAPPDSPTSPSTPMTSSARTTTPPR